MIPTTDSEWLDEDGYPTAELLDLIEHWNYLALSELFEFIKPLWRFADSGYWKECESIDEITGKKSYCYHLSTAGWSGNESIIHAMQVNRLVWSLTWVQSRRGGHYIFELREFDDKEKA
jgi:hypothetical protein